MNNQGAGSQHQFFLNILLTHGVGLAYFLGSQKELGPARLRGEAVEGKPDSDLDLGVVLLEHPLDYALPPKMSHFFPLNFPRSALGNLGEFFPII